MPGLNFNVFKIEKDLDEFAFYLEEINMDTVKQRVLKYIADEMAQMVRQAVLAEEDITTPSVNSKWGQGSAGGEGRSRGASMSREKAWNVSRNGPNSYKVSPHPKVRQRAYVLNFGYPGVITPTNAEYMRFYLEGMPIFRKEVNGPEPTHYWSAAYRRMEQSGKLQRIGEEELKREFEGGT